MARVLVTGGTGLLGTHCLLQLLMAGYETNATVRDLEREHDVRTMLRRGGAGEVGGHLNPVTGRSDSRCGFGRSDGRLRLCAPRASTLSEHCAQGRE